MILLKDIISNKQFILSNDEKLNGLIVKMLKINVNERISWNDYFNHLFFKEDNFDLPEFDFMCNKHLKIINNYCINCKKNICQIV